jgi:hypothetical protein
MNTAELSHSHTVATPFGCGGTCGCSDPIGLERTRFFPRMLVGPDELTQDQRWIKDKLRRHNRLLHGWGVVCGCNVTQATDAQGRPVPWVVCVEQGYVLGPYGDEIVVDCPVMFDIRTSSSEPGPCAPPVDPWCVEAHTERRPEEIFYVAVRYDEYPTRPVRTLAGCGCGCDEAECEYSRIRESFALAALDALPESYRDFEGRMLTGEQPTFGAVFGLEGAITCSRRMLGAVRPCPPCPTDHWVILADVTADSDGILTIDPIRHRRYVATFGSYWFTCGAAQTDVKIDKKLKDKVLSRLTSRAADEVEELGVAVSNVETLEATALKGVNRRTALGRLVSGRSIAEVADTTRPNFVKEAREAGVAVERARELWDNANALTRLVRGGEPAG